MPLLGRRAFAALIDQDGVALVEYKQEKDGFRVLGARLETRHFETIEVASDAVIGMLEAERATNASLAIAVQHFGSFYHSMVLPEATDEILRPIIVREVQRVFDVADPVIAFSRGPTVDRREAPRGEAAKPPRQVQAAGMPRQVLNGLQARLNAAGVTVKVLTVVPETLRRVYDALAGSADPTALLVCRASGPNLAYLIDGRIERAIEPPIALEGERSIDPAVVVDQVERGAVFLRQQTRGSAATRILLAAQPADYPAIAQALEARTSMTVQPLAKSTGAPEAIVAMGAVLESRSDAPMDLYPRAPTLSARMQTSVRGRGALPTAFAIAAGLVALWAGVQFATLTHTRREIVALTDSVNRAQTTIAPLREAVQARAGLATLHADLAGSKIEQRQLVLALRHLITASGRGLRIDNLTVRRTGDGWQTTLRVQSTGATGGTAIREINSMYETLARDPAFKSLSFEDDGFGWSTTDQGRDSIAAKVGGDSPPVRVTAGVSFVIPIQVPR